MVIEYFLDWVSKAPVDKRAKSAGALVRAYLNKDIDENEREDVEAALTVLLDDTSPEVRLEIAVAFGARMSAPRHIISALAGDIDDIAQVVLSHSPVFHDSELVEFIKSGDHNKQIAISCRPWLSNQVLTAICDLGSEESCIGAMANPIADFSYENLHNIAVRFGDIPEIRDILSERDDIAAETRLHLITKLSMSLSSVVASNEWLSPEAAEKVALEACDKAAITFAASVSEDDVERIAKSLIEEGRMNVAFLLRSVCMGNIMLAASAFSLLSGVKFSRVESILTKDRQSAFKAVYDRAGLPKSAFAIFACAISTWRRLLSSNSEINQTRMPFLVTRDVLEMYSSNSDAVVDELMVLLRKLSAETARESAKSKAAEIAQRGQEALEHYHASQEVEVLQLEGPQMEILDSELDEVIFDFDEAEFLADVQSEITASSVIYNGNEQADFDDMIVADFLQEADVIKVLDNTESKFYSIEDKAA